MFLPPPKLTVSEWADKYRILGRDESPNSGRWKTETTPYLKAIMDSFTDKTTEIIAFLKPTQVGATEVGINICGYTIDYSPTRIFYLMPDEELARDFSTDRLSKAFKHTPSIARKLDQSEKSKALTIRYSGGFIKLSGAQSASKLASWAIPRVIMDEVDKYPLWAGREASPIALVMERTKNWSYRKILIMSTPTTEGGYIYNAYQNSEQHNIFYIPCPKCKHYQELQFKNLKFPDTLNDNELMKKTYYQCEACGYHMNDRDKLKGLKVGEWRPREKLNYKPKRVGFKLNSLYSPWVSFATMAKEFLKSKNEPSKLMNFVNSWLGEPWKQKGAVIKSKSVLEHKVDLPSGIVPSWAVFLSCGVDVQQGYFYWVVRAWGANFKSQKIANGTAITFDDLLGIINRPWKIENSNKTVQIFICGIDSGYNTEEVYAFCARNYPVTVPIKGRSTPLVKYFKISQLGQSGVVNVNGYTQVLYEVDTNKYKDLINYKLSLPIDDPTAWLIDKDTDHAYADMITSEQKIDEKGDGKLVWKKISSARENHYLDCEVYAMASADFVNARLITEDDMTVGEL